MNSVTHSRANVARNFPEVKQSAFTSSRGRLVDLAKAGGCIRFFCVLIESFWSCCRNPRAGITASRSLGKTRHDHWPS